MPLFHGVPGKMTLIVSEVPTKSVGTVKAHSLAELRTLFAGNEDGYLTDPTGEKHYFSLKPWAKANPDTTFLQIAYRFTPEVSIPADNPLYPRISQASNNNSNVTAFAVRNKNHELAIRTVKLVQADSTANEQQMSVSYLLTFPEVKVTHLPCPLCDMQLELSSPLEKTIRTLALQLDTATTTIEVSISHPNHVKETKQRPPKYPFTIMRHEEQ